MEGRVVEANGGPRRADADSLVGVAEQIASDLVAAGPDGWHGDPGLAGGSAGIALFLAELGRVTDDTRWDDAADRLLDAAIADFGQPRAISPSLFTGPLGLGWVLTQLEGRLYEVDPSDNDADLLVDTFLRTDAWAGHYDLIDGLVGIGTYLLARLPRPSAQVRLATVVAHLTATAERSNEGVTWRVPPLFAARVPERAERYPDGYYDLGLAHGVAGVVAFLAGAADAGVAGAISLLRSGLDWLLAHDPDGGGDYPALYGPGETPVGGSRLAWCYGDLSLAIAFARAGRTLGDDELLDRAHRLIGRAAAVEPARSGVADACLCHGSAGAAHIFFRLADLLDRPQVSVAADFWLGQTLASHDPDRALGGFEVVSPAFDGTFTSFPAPGFLEGGAGIGLALLAASGATSPWDTILLLPPTP